MKRLMLALIVVVAAPGVAHADEQFARHMERAQALSQNEQYIEALKELEAAYAIAQPPGLLFLLGRAHHRLGHAREAIDYYGRFLAADRYLHPDTRAMVERTVAELHKTVAASPPPAAPPPAAPNLEPQEHPPALNPYSDLPELRVRSAPRGNRGLIVGGAVLLGAGYMAAFISGVMFTLFGGGAVSGTLFVPVLGPFISGFMFLSVKWAVPWILVDGMAQAAGLAMIIVGARSRRKPPVYGDRLRIAPWSTPGSGGLTLTARF